MIKTIINISKASGLFFFLGFRHLANINACDALQLFEQFSALYITVEDVLKDGDIVFFDLLLNLEDVQVCRELIDFTSADRVNKTSFSNTVATNETVLAAFYKLYACIIQ